MRLNLRKQGGFTLIEVTIILLVLVILSTIMLPQLGNFNRLARFVKAKEDLGAICASLKKMLDEVMLGTVYQTPNGDNHQTGPTSPIGLLVGPGAVPTSGTVTTLAAHNIKSGDVGWFAGTISKNDCMEITTDAGSIDVDFDCDFLANHLQRNSPFGQNAGANRYKNVFDGVTGGTAHPSLDNTMIGAAFGWRGPYLDALTPDPWGNRYAVNTFALFAPANGDLSAIYSSAVVCYSTGPDLGVDTVFNQPQDTNPSTNGWQTGGDDLAVILSAYGPF